MNWGTGFSTVGFNIGDRVQFLTLPGTDLDEGVLSLHQRSNVGPDSPGVWMFRVDQPVITQPTGINFMCLVVTMQSLIDHPGQ